jgi:DNA-directed RNA polymerase alpha subunit
MTKNRLHEELKEYFSNRTFWSYEKDLEKFEKEKQLFIKSREMAKQAKTPEYRKDNIADFSTKNPENIRIEHGGLLNCVYWGCIDDAIETLGELSQISKESFLCFIGVGEKKLQKTNEILEKYGLPIIKSEKIRSTM